MATSKPVLAVLDDEPELRKALRRLLTGRGFCVEEYERGSDFIAALGSRPLDCLLLDLHMAEVSGFDVLEVFQSRHIQTPVIVIDRKSTRLNSSHLVISYAVFCL